MAERPAVLVAKADVPVGEPVGTIPAGTTVLELGVVEGVAVCCAAGPLLFRVDAGDLEAWFRVVDFSGESAGEVERDAMGLTLSLLLLGGAGLVAAEAGSDGGIRSFEDALWYGINTVSTVGVGDVTPETSLGKLIASGLMVLGNPLYARMGEDFAKKLLGAGDRQRSADLAAAVRRFLEGA